MNKVTLEEDLIKQGFKPFNRPVSERELPSEISLLYSEAHIKPDRVEIVRGEVARENNCKYPGTYI